MLPLPAPRSTLFPYSTLFRSRASKAEPAQPSLGTLGVHESRRNSDEAGAEEAHRSVARPAAGGRRLEPVLTRDLGPERDRKSTRLNSSHVAISYAVFCLKKKR